MFSNILIGFVAGLGVAGWIYSKMQHGNGGQTGNSLLVAGAGGVGVWVVIVMILGAIF